MIDSVRGIKPQIDENSFVAASADVIGNVSVAEGASVWYQVVARGDVESISIGKYTNIQDLSVLHTSKGHPLVIGEGITVGHRAICHGCTIEDHVLVGMGSIILDGAHIEKNVIIGAGSLIPPRKRIPSGTLVMGSPAKVVRELTDDEIDSIRRSASGYVELSQYHKSK